MTTEITEKMKAAFLSEVVVKQNEIFCLDQALAAAFKARYPEPEQETVPADLAVRLSEILAWRKSGVAELPALNAYVDKHLANLGDIDTLRIAEEKTLLEAARLLVKMAGARNG